MAYPISNDSDNKLSPSKVELIEIQATMAQELVYELSMADPWNHYYPNLRASLHSFLSHRAPSASYLASGLRQFKDRVEASIKEDSDLLRAAPGFYETSFHRFLHMLNEWSEFFNHTSSQV